MGWSCKTSTYSEGLLALFFMVNSSAFLKNLFLSLVNFSAKSALRGCVLEAGPSLRVLVLKNGYFQSRGSFEDSFVARVRLFRAEFLFSRVVLGLGDGFTWRCKTKWNRRSSFWKVSTHTLEKHSSKSLFIDTDSEIVLDDSDHISSLAKNDSNSIVCNVSSQLKPSPSPSTTLEIKYSAQNNQTLATKLSSKLPLDWKYPFFNTKTLSEGPASKTHPLKADLAEKFTKDKNKFFKKAEEFTMKNSAKRPSE